MSTKLRTTKEGRWSSDASLHAVEKPERCLDGHAEFRTILCDGTTDIKECVRCGKQIQTACDFDEEYA